MTVVGILWALPYQHKGKIIKAAAAMSGFEVAEPAFYEHWVDNRKPEFLDKFPHGKIPAFEGADGLTLFEGLAIARYVAGINPVAGLLGSNVQETALVDQWTHYMETEVEAPTVHMMALINGHVKAEGESLLKNATENQLKGLRVLDQHAASHAYFVGEKITLADLVVAGTMHVVIEKSIDATKRAQVPNLIRHYKMIIDHPKVKEIFGP
ncbi:hypothetical protein AX17_005979, partial [Amanita inopinata Kibby_2008]